MSMNTLESINQGGGVEKKFFFTPLAPTGGG